jgi:hypothetical protein
MARIKIYVSKTEAHNFSDATAALSAVDRMDMEFLTASKPTIIELQIDTATMTIGVGNLSGIMLSYSPNDDPGASYDSFSKLSGDGVLRFEFDGQMTYVPKNAAISRDLAKKAILYFLDKGERFSEVDWIEA